MDQQINYANVFGVIFLIFLVGLLKYKYPVLRGRVGERWINQELSKLPQEYKVIHNILLKTEKGTSQLDHIAIGPKGVFVIETKTYQGWIFGDEKEKMWTQVIYRKKSKFYNPIWQNYRHIKALQERFPQYSLEFIPIVVFTGGAELKKVTSSVSVIRLGQLRETILQYRYGRLLGKEEIESFYQALLMEDQSSDKKLTKQHIKSIKGKKITG